MSDGTKSEAAYVDVPTDLQVAIAEHANATDGWLGLTKEERQAHVSSLEDAPDDVARARRITQLVHDLSVRVPPENRR